MAKDRCETQHHKLLETWRFWHVAGKYIGHGVVARMFGVGKRTIYDYAADPAYVAKKGCRDLLERMHDLLRLMDDMGGGQYARAALEYLATAVEGGFCRGMVQEPRESLMEEQLLDYGSVAEMHKAIEAGESLELVEELKRASVEEIERTYLRYVMEQEEKGE